MTGRLRAAIVLALLIGAAARLSVLAWEDPWGPHHPDETVLSLEALALWEGITPREVGWPASTTRLLISGAAAVTFLLEQGHAVWEARAKPLAVFERVSHWIGTQYIDPAGTYRIGRTLSLLTGLLQLVAMVWAGRRWFGPSGILWTAVLGGISPIAVPYSQYVLSDIQGLLFATIIVGLAAQPTRAAILAMAVIAGLAAASKFHFGLWMLTPLVCIWLRLPASTTDRLKLTAAVGVLSAAVVVAFVPWLWVNPLLALKEFANVVLLKIENPHDTGGVAANARVLFWAIGPLAWGGAAIGLLGVWKDWRRFAPILVPVALGVVGLGGAAIVFDRYGLVLLPGLVVLASMGWPLAFRSGRPIVLIAAAFGVIAAATFTAADLVANVRRAAQMDVDVTVQRWITAHVSRGARVAMYDETVAPLPRDTGQLRACVERLDSPAAYREKWQLAGTALSPDAPRAMESVLLNDERFYQYWCLRELEASTDAGYRVVSYHQEPRFWSILLADAVERFRAGDIDVLVLNRDMDIGIPPAHVVNTLRGRRAIYVRPGLSGG